MSLWHRLMLVVLLALPRFSAAAGSEPESIDWVLWPIPSAVIVVDGKPADGTAVRGLQLLMDELPQFKANYRLGNRLRQQRDMQQGRQFCSMPLLPREDSDQYGLFIPYMVSTPIQAVVRHSDLPELPLQDGNLSLTRVLAETSMQIGASAHRTYPPQIRKLIDQAHAMQRAQRIAGSPSGENLLRMVSHGRIDLTFEFSSVTQAFTRHTMLPEPLYSLPVAEHRELVITGIYCTRSAWGERVIAELEQGVRRISANPLALLDIYRQWVPQETFEAFEKQLLDYYAGRGLSP